MTSVAQVLKTKPDNTVYTVATGWEVSYQLLVRPRVGELLFNTLRLTVATVAGCTLIGTAGAWLTERTTLPCPSLFRVLLVAPLAVPSFVNSFAWISLTPSVESYGGAVLVVTLGRLGDIYGRVRIYNAGFAVFTVGSIALALDPLDIAEDRLAGRCQDIAARRLLEQLGAHALFQAGKPPAHGGLSDAQAAGGGREAAQTGDGEEVPQVIPIKHMAKLCENA